MTEMTEKTQLAQKSANNCFFSKSNFSFQRNEIRIINLVYQLSYTKMSRDSTQQLNKTLGEQSGNAKAHLDSATNLYADTSKLHHQFNQDLTNLTNQIAILKEKVKKNPLDLKKFLVQKMRPLEDELMFGEENQKHENKAAQESMTEIKRENKETAEAIIKTVEKLKYLEIKIGHYH